MVFVNDARELELFDFELFRCLSFLGLCDALVDAFDLLEPADWALDVGRELFDLASEDAVDCDHSECDPERFLPLPFPLPLPLLLPLPLSLLFERGRPLVWS